MRPARATSSHLAQALLLKSDVADGEHFVDQQESPVQMGSDGKSEADVHAAGIMLHRCVDELFELGKSDDFVEFARDFALAHAENRAAEKSVLAARQFGVEAGADFEQATNASVNLRPSGGGFCNARKDFQQGSLTGTIAANEAEDFALADFEGDIFQSPKRFIFGALEDRQR